MLWKYISPEEVVTDREALAQIYYGRPLVTYSHKQLIIGTTQNCTHMHKRKNKQNEEKYTHLDSFISEIAEERVELDTVGMGITPPIQRYQPVIERLQEGIRKAEFNGVSRITQAFRDRYYDIVKRTLVEKRQIIPCLAGVASAQIAPNGDVWTCCIRAESVGNLREHNYDFRATWNTTKANELRRSIKAGECYCPLANASYTNMLCHTPTVASVAVDVARGTVAAAISSSEHGQSAKRRNLPVINASVEASRSDSNGNSYGLKA